MGGNALKTIFTRRYALQEYNDLCVELLPRLKEVLNTDISVLESFGDKDTFGDMDVLVYSEGLDNIRDLLEDSFNPGEIHKNGNVYSFDYKELQIDLILTSPENWETSKLFFRYGDMGNLLGKMYHKINIKYGWRGLQFVIRDYNDTKKLGEINISKNGEDIFEFMGLSWDRYKQGFETETDIFDYIISSRFFDPEVFLFSNLNAINKKRNKRRKSYNNFIKYVADLDVKPKYTFSETDKTSHIEEIQDFFNINLVEQMDKFYDDEKLFLENKAKFNGKHIIEWTGITAGKEIGSLVSGFKNYITEDFNTYISNSTSEDVKIEFLKYFYGK